MTPTAMQRILDRLQKQGTLPNQLTKRTVDEMGKSMSKYFNEAAKDKIVEFTEKAKSIAQKALEAPEFSVEGATPDRLLLADFIEAHGEEKVAETMNMELFFRVPREVSYGAGNYVRQNASEEAVDEYPALELLRVYDRATPRGSSDRKGDDDWFTRWEAAGGTIVDTRMVALKSDPVWQALGNGEGGYTDTLGNPFPPFAFNSGYEVDEIDRAQAEELGLLKKDETAEPAELDVDKLFAV